MITKVIGKQKALGIGKPDFSKNVSSAKERRGIRLEYSQHLKMYFRSCAHGIDPAYPLVIPDPIPVGGSRHLIDFETNTETPFPVDPGYTLTLIAVACSFTQDAAIYAYIDYPLFYYCLGTVEAGFPVYENRIVGISSLWFDPTAAYPHTVDLKVYNLGLGDLFGTIVITCILKAMGTPPWPTTKECRCPYCGNRQVVPVNTTKVKCTKCGKLYLVCDFSKFKEGA